MKSISASIFSPPSRSPRQIATSAQLFEFFSEFAQPPSVLLLGVLIEHFTGVTKSANT